jgi:hypothetical protein
VSCLSGQRDRVAQFAAIDGGRPARKSRPHRLLDLHLHQFGEGQYEQSERILQHLLAEAPIGGIGHELVSVDARGAEAAADWGSLRSPENYVGYERTENFASPGGAVLGSRRVMDSRRARLSALTLTTRATAR